MGGFDPSSHTHSLDLYGRKKAVLRNIEFLVFGIADDSNVSEFRRILGALNKT